MGTPFAASTLGGFGNSRRVYETGVTRRRTGCRDVAGVILAGTPQGFDSIRIEYADQYPLA